MAEYSKKTVAERVVEAAYTGGEALFAESDTSKVYEFTPDGIKEYIQTTDRTKPFASRDEAKISLIPDTVEEIAVMHKGFVLRFKYDPVVSSSYAALTTADGKNWSPADTQITTLHFGAVEDWSRTTGLGTDDYDAFNRGILYLTQNNSTSGFGGGTLWVYGQSVVSQPIRLTQGIRLQGIVAPVSGAQVGQVSYPISGIEGSKVVGSGTEGPVVWINGNRAGVVDLVIDSTPERYDINYETPISVGAGNTNCGVLIETNDSSGQVMILPYVRNVSIRNQIADGVYVSGDAVSSEIESVTVVNVGRHGIVFDGGQLAQRANKARPGLSTIRNCRQNNCGGHALAIGHPDAGAEIPYRILIENNENFRCGNDAEKLYRSCGVYIRGEQITMDSCAPSGTTGYTGNTAGLAYTVSVHARHFHARNCRYIGYVTNPMEIYNDGGYNNYGVVVENGHASTGAAYPVNFLALSDTSPTELKLSGLTGNFTGDPINYSIFTGSGEITYTNVKYIFKNILRASAGVMAPITSAPTFTLEDNQTGYFEFNGITQGILVIAGSTSAGRGGSFFFRLGDANAHCTTLTLATGITTGVGTLTTGTSDGTDGSLNIFVDNATSRLYIKNMTAAARTYSVTFLSIRNSSGGSFPTISAFTLVT